jgi:hypothetical protein
MNHTKPTQAELDANIQAAAAEIDQLEAAQETTQKETDDHSSQEDTVADVQDDTVVDDKGETDKPIVTADKKEETKSDVEKEPDFKEKFAQSTRENQLQAARNKKLSEALAKVGEDVVVTDEDCKKEYSDWEDMNDREKRFAKDTLVNNRRFNAIKQVNNDFKNLDAWEEKVNTFLDDPEVLVKNPSLDGRESEFRTFAAKESRIGIDFEDLVASFLYRSASSKTKKKGQMFERGTGGDNQKSKPKSTNLTHEQGQMLRKTDYKKYSQFLQEGKIDSAEF